MDVEEFRLRGKEMVDYICAYLATMNSKRVTPDLEPGYLQKILPYEAPQEPEEWDDIMEDVDRKIMPGVTHWQHPHFHAYFPSGNSFPSILGDMLSDAIGCIGFSWAASPACTELETIVMNWFGKAIGLPKDFIFTNDSQGGGVIQSSASECVLVSLLSARNEAIKHLQAKSQETEMSVFLPKLVAYCSKDAHSCVEKAAMILLVKLRILEPDDNCSLRGETLEKAMQEDEANGLLPFFVSATLGSTACCAFDNLEEIGPVCKSRPCVWLHVDGAYAGNAFICPELQPLMKGIEYADSFNTNPNKWLLVNFDCSCVWVKDRLKLTSALIVDPLYLQHSQANKSVDYRHWGIPLSRRFRSLKLWFVFRKYGISGLQKYIRNHINLAKYFESLVKSDERFEVVNDVKLGLVCFRLIAPDSVNQTLLATLNASGKLHMIPSIVKGKYIIRFCVVSEFSNETIVDFAWTLIRDFSTKLIKTIPLPLSPTTFVKPPLTRTKSRIFSFTRSVSRDMYHRSMSKSCLCDGASPILIPSDDDECETPPDNESVLDAIITNSTTNGYEQNEKEVLNKLSELKMNESTKTKGITT